MAKGPSKKHQNTASNSMEKFLKPTKKLLADKPDCAENGTAVEEKGLERNGHSDHNYSDDAVTSTQKKRRSKGKGSVKGSSTLLESPKDVIEKVKPKDSSEGDKKAVNGMSKAKSQSKMEETDATKKSSKEVLQHNGKDKKKEAKMKDTKSTIRKKTEKKPKEPKGVDVEKTPKEPKKGNAKQDASVKKPRAPKKKKATENANKAEELEGKGVEEHVASSDQALPSVSSFSSAGIKPSPLPAQPSTSAGSSRPQKSPKNVMAVSSTPSPTPGTASPVRKRPRLSLNKASRGVQKLEQLLRQDSGKDPSSPSSSDSGQLCGMESKAGGNKSDGKTEASKVGNKADVKTDISSGVAALHNLGNTCFLNSVLQVLRYTPGFVENVGRLAEEINLTLREKEELQHQENTAEEDEEENLTWTLVQNLQGVYAKMATAEHNFKAGTSNYLAIRPYELMDTIELLNPMFEGNQQQDAHELLRCVLAYVQDAAKELNKFRCKYRQQAANLSAVKCTDVQKLANRFTNLNGYTNIKTEPTVVEVSPVTDISNACMSLQHGSPLKTSVQSLTKSLGEVYKSDIVKVKEEPTNSGTTYREEVYKSDILKAKEEPARSGTTTSSTTPSKHDNIAQHLDGIIKSCLNTNQSPKKILESADLIEPCEEEPKVCRLSLKRSPKKLYRTYSAERSPRKLYRSYSSDVINRIDNKNNRNSPSSPLRAVDRFKHEQHLLSPNSRSSSLNDIVLACETSCKKSEPEEIVSKGHHDLSHATKTKSACKKRKLSDPILPAPKSRVARSRSRSDTLCDEQLEKEGILVRCGSDLSMDGKADVLEKSEPAARAQAQNLTKSKTNQPSIASMFCRQPGLKRPGGPGAAIADDNQTVPVGQESDADGSTGKDTATVSPPSGVRKDTVAVDQEISFTVRFNESRAARAFQRSHREASMSPIKKSSSATENKELHSDHSTNSGVKSQENGSHSSLAQENLSVKGGNDSKVPWIGFRAYPGVRRPQTARKSLGVRRTPSGFTRRVVTKQENSTIVNTEKSESDCSRKFDTNEGEKCDNSGSLNIGVSESGIASEGCCVSEATSSCSVSAEEDCKKEPQSHAVVSLCQRDVTKYLSQQRVVQTMQSTVDVSDIIEEAFQGEMALRTRCLECERSTERREDYQDISVAVRRQKQEENSDDEEDEVDNNGAPWSWMMSAFHEVERLRDDNKYYCEECLLLVEAERSTHYITMANIMTFHLKRFAATSGLFGGLTKINDHVVTPLSLPCLQEKCGAACHDSSHSYELYGVVTHTGISISSGHYVAYVKVLVPPSQHQMADSEAEPVGGEMKQSSEAVVPSGSDSIPMETGDAEMADPNNNADGNNNVAVSAEIVPAAQVPPETSAMRSESTAEPAPVYQWLECDDDHVRILSCAQFEHLLSPAGCSTPYLLFYRRVTTESGKCA